MTVRFYVLRSCTMNGAVKRKRYSLLLLLLFFKMAIQTHSTHAFIYIYTHTLIRVSKGTELVLCFFTRSGKKETRFAMAAAAAESPPPTSPRNTRVLPGSLITSYLTYFLLLFSGTFFLFSGSRTPHGRTPAARRPDGRCQYHVLSAMSQTVPRQ